MELIHNLFKAEPLTALFASIALGYFVGKLKIGRFVLGGIAGTLLIGVLIGQFRVQIHPSIETFSFALFIYAVGYQGGPKFISSLNLKSLAQLSSATLMTFIGLGTVLLAAWWFNLDRGTAAGLAAGGLTQSAIIGTADSALAQLDLAPEVIKQMKTNVAVGYAVCYIFGSLGPILVVAWFLPMVMKWDLRKEAIDLAKKLAGGKAELEPGQFDAANDLTTRFFMATDAGGTVDSFNKAYADTAIVCLIRDGKSIDFDADTVLESGDAIGVLGFTKAFDQVCHDFSKEITSPDGVQIVEEKRELIMSGASKYKSLADFRRDVSGVGSGVFLQGAKRRGDTINLTPDFLFRGGDSLELVGLPKDLNAAQSKIGYKVSAAAVTDFIFFGIGMTIGMLIGLITFKLGGIPVTLGSGVGCLLSGLFFGWVRFTRPRFAALPEGASNFLRDFGLAVFVALVGINAAPQALDAIKQNGLTLLLLGAGVTIIPQIITFYISYYVLRIRNPIIAMSVVAGGRSANPAFAALLEKAGNTTPVAAFTITYAIANIFLTLWGPVVVGAVQTNAVVGGG
ncbi:MAG: aspartate-alanine antiporter [Phycisphaerae bacterium]|jgi:putative transport protein|nr:aspartate-alanine antiporter [Phycisphaerae bacterium]MBT5582674.1 aspartate-alanine antiporter [Phycisphaerae bacterium]MBT5657526.1 aspartate-alanine antiporter [Phycisphaerae bacterium]MBT7351872.1 aspartate-alanine antiporter [Phycisphaerae bacterium]